MAIDTKGVSKFVFYCLALAFLIHGSHAVSEIIGDPDSTATLTVITAVENGTSLEPISVCDVYLDVFDLEKGGSPTALFAGGGDLCDQPGQAPLQGVVNVGLTPSAKKELAEPAAYAVSAPAIGNYVVTFGEDCAGIDKAKVGTGVAPGELLLAAGELKTCTVTYTYVEKTSFGTPNALLTVVTSIENGASPEPIGVCDVVLSLQGAISIPGGGEDCLDPEAPFLPSATLQVGLELGTPPFDEGPYIYVQGVPVTDYAVSYGGDCLVGAYPVPGGGGVELNNGEHKTCTVTYTYVSEGQEGSTATLTVITAVENGTSLEPISVCDVYLDVFDLEKGGSPTALFAGGGDLCDQPGQAPLQGVVNVGLTPSAKKELAEPAAYAVSAPAIGNYVVTFGEDCAGIDKAKVGTGVAPGELLLAAGELKTCTVTYTYVEKTSFGTPNALLTVVTSIENGASPEPIGVCDVVLSLQGAISIPGGGEDCLDPEAPFLPSATLQVGLELGTPPFDEGPYIYVQGVPVTDYAVSYGGDCLVGAYPVPGGGGVELNNGEHKTCTVTYAYSGPVGAGTGDNLYPNAVADNVSTPEDTAVTIFVLANDNDPDGDALAVVSLTSPAHGTATHDGNTVSYEPGLNYFGADAITYTISDGNGGTATASVQLTVTAVNDAPMAVDQDVETLEDTSLVITLGADDVDNDALGYAVAGGPAHGALSGTPPNVTYTPASNYYGSDSFTFTVDDGHGGTDSAIVTITVTPVNDEPVARDDVLTTDEDVAASIAVLTNDTDVDSSTLTVTVESNPNHGSVSKISDGTLIYAPEANYSGPDSFTYKANDGQADSNTATVSVTVTPVDDPLIAHPDSAETSVNTPVTTGDVLANDQLGDEPTTITSYDTVSLQGGDVAYNEDSTFNYTPPTGYSGSDSFTYTISDADGDTNIGTVTVTITVPDAQVFVSSMAYYSSEIGGVDGGDAICQQLANQAGLSNPENFMSWLSSSSTYPKNRFSRQGPYVLTDGAVIATSWEDLTDGSIAVPINVDESGATLPDAVTAEVWSGTSATGLPASGSNYCFDWGPEGLGNSWKGETDKVDGNWSSSVLSDCAGFTAHLYCFEQIGGPISNLIPVAQNDFFSTLADTPLTGLQVLANDTLGDEPTVIPTYEVTSLAGGSVVLNPDQTFDYTPPGGFSGEDTFSYTIRDSDGDLSEASVFIEVSTGVFAVYTINPTTYGRIGSIPGENWQKINTFTGQSNSNVEFRSAVQFSLPTLGIDEIITSAVLRNTVSSTDGTGPWEINLYDVANDTLPDSATGGGPLFVDLGTGSLYGMHIVPVDAAYNDVMTASLSGAALADMNTGLGSDFSIGMKLLGLDGTSGYDYVFWQGIYQTELVLTTAIVPTEAN